MNGWDCSNQSCVCSTCLDRRQCREYIAGVRVEAKTSTDMDWELKTSTADFTESSREDNARLAEVVGSSSSGVRKNAGGFSVDLKLGGLGDLGDGSADKLEEPRGCTIVSSSSGSSKRTRAANGTENMSCLVDGCAADLSKCRKYHRRHRVCERHSKTPVVLVGGKELRFCQQCSRFESLGEFDEKKRSCRKRLDGHNRRRRKPRQDAFMSSGSSFLSNHRGARLVQFGGPLSNTTPAASVIVPTWPMVGKQHRQSHVTDRQSTAPNSLPCTYNGGDKRFPFLLGNDPAERNNQRVPEVSICRGLVDDYCYGPADGSKGPQKKSSSDGLAQSINSKCALSLLSTHSAAQSSSSGMGMDGHLVQFSRSQGMERRSPILVPQDNNNVCNEIVKEVAPDDLLENGISRVLPFSSWK